MSRGKNRLEAPAWRQCCKFWEGRRNYTPSSGTLTQCVSREGSDAGADPSGQGTGVGNHHHLHLQCTGLVINWPGGHPPPPMAKWQN